jgi:hypothetical protein
VNLAITFPAHLLPLLVPDGGTLDSTWVVCHAHRPTVEVNSIPALGDIDGWQPTIPFESQDAAAWWAEKFARATIDGEPDQLNWHPADDEGGPGLELYAVLDDGTEHQVDLAIVPLTMLAENGGR